LIKFVLADIPVTTPAAVTLADRLIALHAPPGMASAKVMLCPTHTDDGPVTGAVGFTNIDLAAIQPLLVSTTTSTGPLPTALSKPVVPVALIVPIDGILVLHVPAVVFASASVDP
jgi:hypothetical protein